MKSVKYLASAIVVLALASCNIGLGSQDGLVSGGEPLPADIVRDVARPTGGEFTFETVIPVQLNVEMDLYTLNDFGLVVGPAEHLDGQNTYVFLDDSEGNRIFSAQADEDGRVSATVVLPAAPEDMTLTVLAEGFGERTVDIRDMVDLQAVDRVFSMGRFQEYESRFLARQLTGLEDTDGDGVPDAYDAFPYDFESAFESRVPAEGNLTIAFEDLFGRAAAGDADYNDFVAAYSITEVLDANGLVTSLTVDAEAVKKLAGYDHTFGIRIDSFEGDAVLSRTYIDEGGSEQTVTGLTVSAPAEIVLFENSRNAVGRSAGFTLEFNTPQQRGATDSGVGDAPIERLPLPVAPYNPFAIVKNTGHDIHLIGREPLTEIVDSINPLDTFRDDDGYPWALLVPPVMVGNPPVAEGWDPPAETERIESDDWYPRFRNWRESRGERFADWYLYFQQPYEGLEGAPAPLAGIDPQPLAGDPVVHPASQAHQLLVGDGTTPAYYRSVDSLPQWITLTETTGAVNVNSDAADPPLGSGEQRQTTVEFYTSDNADPTDDDTSGSTLNEPLSVTFVIEREGAAAQPGVYVAGYYEDSVENKDVAVFWLDGQQTELSLPADVPSGTDARANDIFVVGSDVYIVGYYGASDAKRPVVWENEIPTELPSSGASVEATSVHVASGMVYVAGTILDGQNGTPVLWRDGVEYPLLTAPARNGAATDVVVNGGSAIVAGVYDNGATPYTATLWSVSSAGVEEEFATLSPGGNGEALDIDLGSDGNYYVSGSLFNGVSFASVYWVVTAAGTVSLTQGLTSVDVSNRWSKAFGIDEESGVVYSAGYYPDGGDRPAIWTDTVPTGLPGGSVGRALEIDVAGGATNAAGFYLESGVSRAVLWVDGQATVLSDAGAAGAEARSVFAVTQ